jgi:hypothetical protein
MTENNKTPNLFWPVIFVGIGAILLLSNLDLIDIEVLSLWNILRLWPLLLVAIGVSILFGRNTTRMGSGFSLLLGLAVVAAIVLAPSVIKPVPGIEILTETYTEPLADAESARVHLDFDKGGLSVGALSDSELILQAEVTHNGIVDFNSDGSSQRDVILTLDSESDFWGLDIFNSQRDCLVGLNADLPIELLVEIGSGNSRLDLEGVNLGELKVKSSSGKMELVLPAEQTHTNLEASSGVIDIQTVEGTELDLDAEIGSGKMFLTLDKYVTGSVKLEIISGRIAVFVPRGLAVQVIGVASSGNVTVPGDYDQVSGFENHGTWESPGFDQADEFLLLEVDLGSGVVQVQYH